MSKLKIDTTILFPFLSWLPMLKHIKTIKGDIFAGLTVGFVIIPQSMAYAALAGLPIQVGLYTGLVAAIVAGLFGATRQMATGPITIVSLMTATALFTVVGSDTEGYMVYASLLAVFTGLFYILLGNLKLGIIVDFLSSPLIIGFTNAAAIITITSQAGKLFGISYDKGNNYFEGLYNLFFSILENTHEATLLFGSLAILFLVVFKRFFPKAPSVLFLVVLSTYISYYVGFNENLGGSIVKEIPNSLPQFSIPFLSDFIYNKLTFTQTMDLMMYSLIIGLIGFTQTISVSKYIGAKNREKINANKELIGQGITNIFTGLFSGYTVAGSLSKTAVNMRAGAKTGLSSIVTGLFICFTLLYLTPYLYHMPMVILASIILVSVVELIKVKPLITSFKVEKHDGIIGVFTFFITLLFARELHVGIFIGIMLSLSLFIFRTMRPRLVEVAMYKDGHYRDAKLFGLKTHKEISVFRFDGVLYFANAGYFEDKILDFISEKEDLKFVVIDLEWMADIDASGLETLENLIYRLQEDGIKVYLTSLRVRVIKKFADYGFLKWFSKKRIYAKIQQVVDHIEEKYGDDIKMKSLEEFNPHKKKNKKSLGEYILKRFLKR